MHCEKVMHKFNDLLDRTLSAGEEHEMQAHLAACPDCRGEFQLVKNADDILRATVIEMLAEIEVPSNLSQKIGQILSGEKKRQPWKSKLFKLLQAPAFAAAMLLVAASGLFGYYKLIDQSSKNPAVVLSVPKDQVASESTGAAEQAPLSATSQDQAGVKDGVTTEAPYRAASPVAPETAQIVDSPTSSTADAGARSVDSIARQTAPPGRGAGDSFNPKEKSAAGPAQTPATEEQLIPMLSSQSPSEAKMSISSKIAPYQGSLEEATRQVGFTPAVPGYLPPGVDLKDVTWSAGTVYLEYRTERNSFSLTQSRGDVVGVTGEEGGRLTDINGLKAYLQVTGSSTSISWQRGEWFFTVEGDFPREEILKIALSIQ